MFLPSRLNMRTCTLSCMESLMTSSPRPTDVRTLHRQPTADVPCEEKDGRHASATTCFRDKPRIRQRSAGRLLPASRERSLRAHGVAGNGPWARLIRPEPAFISRSRVFEGRTRNLLIRQRHRTCHGNSIGLIDTHAGAANYISHPTFQEISDSTNKLTNEI